MANLNTCSNLIKCRHSASWPPCPQLLRLYQPSPPLRRFYVNICFHTSQASPPRCGWMSLATAAHHLWSSVCGCVILCKFCYVKCLYQHDLSHQRRARDISTALIGHTWLKFYTHAHTHVTDKLMFSPWSQKAARKARRECVEEWTCSSWTWEFSRCSERSIRAALWNKWANTNMDMCMHHCCENTQTFHKHKHSHRYFTHKKHIIYHFVKYLWVMLSWSLGPVCQEGRLPYASLRTAG